MRILDQTHAVGENSSPRIRPGNDMFPDPVDSAYVELLQSVRSTRKYESASATGAPRIHLSFPFLHIRNLPSRREAVKGPCEAPLCPADTHRLPSKSWHEEHEGELTKLLVLQPVQVQVGPRLSFNGNATTSDATRTKGAAREGGMAVADFAPAAW
ncbi:hypothetical protein EsDP_00002496 [Epichloe bromicola]|uniref:Uncharacterized protein n=1 Tax=Epichloe bromicola TaxID=79588 RepID=A0ABQ0CL17_9HYPO